jgi:hypothetical protein
MQATPRADFPPMKKFMFACSSETGESVLQLLQV